MPLGDAVSTLLRPDSRFSARPGLAPRHQLPLFARAALWIEKVHVPTKLSLPSRTDFGPLSLDFFFHIFFFMRYSKMLEENAFHGRKADYLWLLLCSAAMLLVSSRAVFSFCRDPQ